MNIEIEMGRRKQQTRIFINEQEIIGGILDFHVDIMNDPPSVTLKIWPEHLRISGELGAVIALDLKSRIHWSYDIRRKLNYYTYSIFRSVRLSIEKIDELWKRAHPKNSKERY